MVAAYSAVFLVAHWVPSGGQQAVPPFRLGLLRVLLSKHVVQSIQCAASASTTTCRSGHILHYICPPRAGSLLEACHQYLTKPRTNDRPSCGSIARAKRSHLGKRR